jgi:hypothetical protein
MSEINQENNESKQSDSTEIIQLKNKILELEERLKHKYTLEADKIYFIRFVMQKGVGTFPKVPAILNLFPENDPLLIIKDNMKFLLNNDNDMLPINEYKVIDDGLSYLEIDDDEYTWGPKPVIWLLLNESLMENDSKWNDALQSDYELLINNINNDEPFYFQDHNGYSRVCCLEEVAYAIDDRLYELGSHLKTGEAVQIYEDLTILKIAGVAVTDNKLNYCQLEITFKNQKYFWGDDLVYFYHLIKSDDYLLGPNEDYLPSQNIWLISQFVANFIEENY